jgi:hypothetical protein
MHQTWRAGCVSNDQCNLAIIGQHAYGLEQCVAPGVVETVRDVDPIRVELITS